jgi:hypothetical protein
MRPDDINAKHGNPVWKCVTCRAESGLQWWNGLSVAVCQKQECSSKFADMCKAQEEAETAFQEYCRQHYG